MTLEGDLSTLDLADLLQNLDQHHRSGTLRIQGPEVDSALYFRDGRISLFATEGRPELMDVLVASGRISHDKLATARKKRRRKSVGEALVATRALPAEELVALAEARLVADLCELVNSETGAFRFTEGRAPARNVFDTEEERLALGLPVEPLLLEAARRSDHWALIRAEIPSDSAHYVIEREPDATGAADPELFAALRKRLDGARSVREVMAAFPHRRFEAFELLADWSRRRAIRLVRADDLVTLARELDDVDSARASEVVGRALESQPQNLALLEEQARLAQASGDREAAVDALKMIAHLRAEAGETEVARRSLADARELDPTDTALWERSLSLSIAAGSKADAAREGTELAELYRAPGLHKKALAVFERLVAMDPDSWELRRQCARSRVECGQLTLAISNLEEFGRRALRGEDYETAREVFEEILELDPTDSGARQVLEDIRGQVFARRRARRRKHFRRFLLLCGTAVIGTFAWIEGAARIAFSNAAADIGAGYFIEDGRYAEAIQRFEAVRAAYPHTVTSWLDVRRRIADLEAKRDAEALLGPDPPRSSGAAEPSGVTASSVSRSSRMADDLSAESTFVPAPADAEELLRPDGARP